MRKTVLLLATLTTALFLASGVALAQEADTTPPETTLSSWPRPGLYESQTNATFAFSSSEANSTFECKLDGGAFEVCTSPTSSKSYYNLTEGQHTFQVQARDATGNVDLTPAEYTWEIDLTDPVMAWTQRPGRAVSQWEWVTNNSTPTWAYTFSDKNLSEVDSQCSLYNQTLERYVVTPQPCPSPMTFPFELADGYYYFDVWHEDKAYNAGGDYQGFEVDTVAPKLTAFKPTGRTVGRSADVVVTFDDTVYNSARFVNIYKRGSSTPLAVYRYDYWDNKIEIDPKRSLSPATWYTVKVTTGVNDGANNLAVAKTWSFRTKG